MIATIYRSINKVNVDGVTLDIDLSDLPITVSEITWIEDFGFEIVNGKERPLYDFSKYQYIVDKFYTQASMHSSKYIESVFDDTIINLLKKTKNLKLKWIQSEEYKEL